MASPGRAAGEPAAGPAAAAPGAGPHRGPPPGTFFAKTSSERGSAGCGLRDSSRGGLEPRWLLREQGPCPEELRFGPRPAGAV